MQNLSKGFFWTLLAFGFALIVILSVEAKIHDEDELKPLKLKYEGDNSSKSVVKRAADDDDDDKATTERPVKKKSKKRNRATTEAPSNSTSTSTSTNSTTTTKPSSSSTSTEKPSSTTSLPTTPKSSSSASTTTPAETSTTSSPSTSSTTAGPLLDPGDMAKDPLDINRMDQLVKTQNEEYELIKKAMTSTIEWARWLHEHQKSLNPMSGVKFVSYVRTLSDYYFKGATESSMLARARSMAGSRNESDYKPSRRRRLKKTRMENDDDGDLKLLPSRSSKPRYEEEFVQL